MFSAQGFLLWNNNRLVFGLLSFLCKATSKVALLLNLIVMKLSYFLCEACAMNFYHLNGEALCFLRVKRAVTLGVTSAS